jgi:hypothetical protein
MCPLKRAEPLFGPVPPRSIVDSTVTSLFASGQLLNKSANACSAARIMISTALHKNTQSSLQAAPIRMDTWSDSQNPVR